MSVEHREIQIPREPVLAIPQTAIDKIDWFEPFSIRDYIDRYEHLGIEVDHDTQKAAALEGKTDRREAVVFAKVTGKMELLTGETVPCVFLNQRMPKPERTYAGQLWVGLVGGHMKRPEEQNGKVESAIGSTLVREGKEEAVVFRNKTVTEESFNPRQKELGKNLKILGHGMSRSDKVGFVHEVNIVAIDLPEGQWIATSDFNESAGIFPMPYEPWSRFMNHQDTLEDQVVIRTYMIKGLEEELMRAPEEKRSQLEQLINMQLTAYFGEESEQGERNEFHLTPEQNTPPIDRLSLSAWEDFMRNIPNPR